MLENNNNNNNDSNNDIFPGGNPFVSNNENIFNNDNSFGNTSDGDIGLDLFGNNTFEQQDLKKENKRPSLSNVTKPTDKAKIILGIIFATFVIGVISGGVVLHNSFKEIGNAMKNGGNVSNTVASNDSKSANNVSGNTFGGVELASEYNPEQLAVLKKVEKGETLTTAENLLLQKMIFKNVEIKTVIISQYKSYFGN